MRDAAIMRREKLDLARRREELGAQLREKTFEADQLTMLKTAHESEIEWLRERVRTSQEEIDALSATAKQVEGALAESAELKSLLGETMGMNGSEKEKREALDAESRARIRENQELLERLLSEQKAAFEGEVARLEARVREDVQEERDKERAMMQERVDEREKMATAQATKLSFERDEALAGKRSLEEQLRAVSEEKGQAIGNLEKEVDRLKKQIAALELLQVCTSRG